MREIEARDYFISISKPLMDSEGFKLIRRNNAIDLQKDFKDGYHQIQLLPSFYGGHFEFGLQFYLRFDLINNITNRFLNVIESVYNINPTFGVSIGFFGIEKNQLFVDSSDQSKDVPTLLLTVLRDQVFPFFEKFDSVKAVDLEFNREDRSPNLFLHDAFDRPIVSITAAALNRNPKFSYWEQYFRDRLKNASQHRKEKYEALVTHLKEKILKNPQL